MPKFSERDEAVAALSRNGFTGPEIVTLRNNAKRLHVIAERICSEEMSDETAASVERRETALEDEIRAVVAKRNKRVGGFQVFVRFDGDPRGYVVKLELPDGSYNTWGGKEEGFCI